jgi:hypothetical protein
MSYTDDKNDPNLVKGQKEVGQNDVYLILSEEERAKGFIRPVRQNYVHVGINGTEQARTGTACGGLTKMSLPIAETYARDPEFYGRTFCTGCNVHLPVVEFIWEGTNEVVGS